MPGPIFEHVVSPLAQSNDGQLQAIRAGREQPPDLRPVWEVVDLRLPSGDRTLIRTYDRVLIDAYIAGYDRAQEVA